MQDDIYVKIEELKKALTSFKTASQKNPLVPALSMPSIKPLTMPSVKASAPSKLPGVTPSSNKDPKKVAQQLKNPRPKKPNIEVLKTDKNGQWSIEKRCWEGYEPTPGKEPYEEGSCKPKSK